jgi:hypothetical protein
LLAGWRPDVPGDPRVDVNRAEQVEAETLPSLLAGYDFVLNDHTQMPTAAMRRCAGLKHVIFLGTGARSYMNPEELAELGKSGATLAIHLSITNLARVVRDLTPLYGADCPVVVAYRVSWPDQEILRGTLDDIRAKVKSAGFTRTALILVGRALGDANFTESRLYAPDHSHVLRETTSPKPAGSSPPRATRRPPRRSGSATKSRRQ